MAPTILIVGATGNTGRSVTETLPTLLRTTGALADYRVLAMTRSLNGTAAQHLSKIPGVEIVEKNWIGTTASWLREHEVVRVFIASHNEPTQFAEESAFHLAALKAGVKYVVRISTTAANVHPDCDAYYPRSHWAIETLLGSPEFSGLQWTSLQPNIFSTFYLYNAVEFVKQYRKTGKQTTLRLLASEDAPVGIIDPDEVGIVAAYLLSQEDTAVHNQAKYVLNGPQDITGQQIVNMVERDIGTKVQHVSYKDMSFVDSLPHGAAPEMIASIKYAPVTAWEGKCAVSTTSKEVLDLAAPKRTPADVFKSLLEN
ncbi:NmrA-like family protein [Aspergillus puulaauensis]|uniref:NmrA-like domain-containing protein n=1 Tax=Aspergillus puulaauensis TaxID=1220207 RepID=A0A7R8ARI6_9EURO|nr:uncharacterized protein APUU_51659S [Aspergillus puulaauensis]BCS26948.1 hypothetical protein APUU_51659S [Aspergillus puulaauensis]